ncbi:acetyltransferase [Riemerella anatipestifer]|uniref:acetyltransferase n=1 Tax=Riemerella anatipestifer TaxID=34085 RepID=UPI0007F8A8FB|nr:acetyltransferase [Riemerella anatipestifer]MCT6744222.1 acetyltransferase [Riemerella anatipestifer]MCU7545631.1 acetyltransferase [Riemerella anatipestifer]MCU7571772.1 acetyltransferase [Riemerella anatipestifer]MCU7603960.1 acetyltransferase [Riemerella anatipestifer]MCW0475418.1 acetyltransferase [Riemerella anatipestifer]
MKKIAIIGAGGFGQEVFCIWKDLLITQQQTFEFIGFFDDDTLVKSNAYGKVLGKVEGLNNIDYSIEVAIAVGKPIHLSTISTLLNNNNISFPNIIHPTAVFYDKENLVLGKGNIFAPNTMLSCNVTIGNFNIFNTRVTIGHDSKIGDFNVLSPNAQISGGVEIGNLNYLGFNCGVIQQKKIGNNNILGAGSILLRSIKSDSTYIGNPAIRVNF